MSEDQEKELRRLEGEFQAATINALAETWRCLGPLMSAEIDRILFGDPTAPNPQGVIRGNPVLEDGQGSRRGESAAGALLDSRGDCAPQSHQGEDQRTGAAHAGDGQEGDSLLPGHDKGNTGSAAAEARRQTPGVG